MEKINNNKVYAKIYDFDREYIDEEGGSDE